MADKRLMVDSTILIDYFRKTDKNNSRLVSHFKSYDSLYISSITEFEVINGATSVHLQFWDQMLLRFTILNFDSKAAREATEIVRQLKAKRKSIDKPDLFIAATAVAHGLTLDTTNKKHFVHIDTLTLLSE
ncbi:MAG: type II toxin-antitoxin system VapC family toxin [Ferruginibacter sp.]